MQANSTATLNAKPDRIISCSIFVSFDILDFYSGHRLAIFEDENFDHFLPPSLCRNI